MADSIGGAFAVESGVRGTPIAFGNQALLSQQDKLYHMGIRGGMSRNTLANANQRRDWRIYAEFAQAVIRIARPLYADEDLGLELDNTVYALDASTIYLCLSVFPWALFRSTKSAVKLHTLLDLRGNIPTFIHVSDGKMHDVNVLDILVPEPGAFYIMDRGYVDFERLFLLHTVGAFFIPPNVPGPRPIASSAPKSPVSPARPSSSPCSSSTKRSTCAMTSSKTSGS